MYPSISKWVLTKLAIKFNRSILDMSMSRLPHDKIVPFLVKRTPDQSAAESCPTDTPSMSKPIESLESEDTNFPGHEILPAVRII